MKIFARSTYMQFALVGLLAMTIEAHADDASKRAKTMELFQVMRIDKTMSQLMDQASNQGAQGAMAMFPNVKLSAQQQKALDAYLARIRTITHEGLAWQKLAPGFTDLYVQTYSEETIDGLLAFYKSPAGKEMLEKQSEIMTKSSVVVQAAVAEVQPRLRQVMEDMMNDPDMKPANPQEQ